MRQPPAGPNYVELNFTNTNSCISFIKATLSLHTETESGIAMELTESSVQTSKLRRVYNNMSQLGFDMPQYTNEDAAMLTIAEKLAAVRIDISAYFGHGQTGLSSVVFAVGPHGHNPCTRV